MANPMSNLKSFIAPFKVDNGDTITRHVTICSDEATAIREHASAEKAARKAGDTLIYADGRKVWRKTVAPYTFDASDPDGGPIYEWHDDGDRVRHHRVEHTIHPDGRTETRIIRKFWAAYC